MEKIHHGTIQATDWLVGLRASVDWHRRTDLLKNLLKIAVCVSDQTDGLRFQQIETKSEVDHGPDNRWAADSLSRELGMVPNEFRPDSRPCGVVFPEVDATAQP